MLCSSAYERIDHLDYSKAMDDLLLAKEFGASKAELHFLMGLLKRQEGRMSIAMYEFEEALKEDPSIYTKFVGETDKPLFPVPIETRMEVAEAAATMKALEPKIEIGLDKPVTLREPPPMKRPGSRNYDLAALRACIKKHSSNYEVDPLLVEAVARVESGMNPFARSPAGAVGVMQLMPGTAKDMGVKNPFDADQNIRGGAKYLHLMMKQFKDPQLALAAYNAGPGTVKLYNGIPPYPETRKYVPKVMKEFDRLKKQDKKVAQAVSK